MSLDQFYALVTGEPDAFYQVCMTLPGVIQEVVDSEGQNLVPHDTVMDELRAMAAKCRMKDRDMAIAMSVYLLGFASYLGFGDGKGDGGGDRLKHCGDS